MTLAHEVLGGSSAARASSNWTTRVVDAGRGQQLELLVEVGEQAGRRLGAHDHGRVAVEGDDGAAQPPRLGPAAHLGDDGPVTEVDPVVGSDGDGRPELRRRARAVGPDDLHGGNATDRISSPTSSTDGCNIPGPVRVGAGVDQGAPTVTGRGTADDGWDRLEVVYRREHAPMVRLAHLLVRDRGVAEELVQDAFLRLHARLDRVEDPGAYLRTTVVNLCRGHGRRQETARRHGPALAGRDRVEPPPLPPELDEVWQALGRLPERRRDALVLRYYADLPTDEVARLLDTRPSTARSLIRRGLASLRKELEP